MNNPNPTNILELLSNSDTPMSKSDILSALGTYELAQAATEDFDAQATYEYYTNLDGLFYNSVKRIRASLKKAGTGLNLVSIDRKFALTADADTIQEYLRTPQRIGRTGTYLNTISRIQGEVSDEVKNGEIKDRRIQEAVKRFNSYGKVA